MKSNTLSRFEVITIDWMFEDGYVPKRHHKKKRIQKKWIKRYGYSKKVIYKAIIDGDKLYCHSKMLKKLEKNASKSQTNYK